jgi:hypothetical protein
MRGVSRPYRARNRFRPPKPISARTSTATGGPGIVGRPWSSPPTRSSPPRPRSAKSPDGLIAITVNELCRLFHALVIDPARRIADVITWSIYLCRYQDRAKASHYARQALTEPLKRISCSSTSDARDGSSRLSILYVTEWSAVVRLRGGAATNRCGMVASHA